MCGPEGVRHEEVPRHLDPRRARATGRADRRRQGRRSGVDPRPHPVAGGPGRGRPRLDRRAHRRGAGCERRHRRAGPGQRFVGPGLEPALGRKEPDEPRRARARDGAGEARPIARAGSKSPRGRVAWTPERLADERVELKVVDSICPEAVRQTLQKTNSSRGWRFEYESVRHGAANPFVIPEPLAGWRHATVTGRRTATDSAEVLRWRAEDAYAEAETVVLVMDDPSAHERGRPVRRVRARAGAPARRAVRGPPRARAREPAERGGGRAERARPPVPGPADRTDRGAAEGTGAAVRGAERSGHRGQRALHDRQRPDRTPATRPRCSKQSIS